jgi:hypothetical protein
MSGNEPRTKRINGTPEERFWPKVDARGDCWEWTASITDDGYGRFKGHGTMVNAHRFAWELLVGPVPAGMVLDHLCRNRKCVNPDHMEPVTPKENTRRGFLLFMQKRQQTHCVHGHPLSGSNLGRDWRGHRRCKTCAYAHARRWQATRKAVTQ